MIALWSYKDWKKVLKFVYIKYVKYDRKISIIKDQPFSYLVVEN